MWLFEKAKALMIEGTASFTKRAATSLKCGCGNYFNFVFNEMVRSSSICGVMDSK